MLIQTPKIISMLDFYRDLSEIYDMSAAISSHFPDAGILHKMARPYMANRVQNLLDVGIGTGLSSKPFAAEGRRITGVDGSPQMIDLCLNKNIAGHVLCVDFERAALPFADGEFDMTFSSNTLYLLSRAEHVIGDMIRVTRSGGLVAFNYEVSETGKPEKRENDATVKIGQRRSVYTYALSQEFVAAVLADKSMNILAAQKGPVARKCDGSPLIFETLVCRKPAI